MGNDKEYMEQIGNVWIEATVKVRVNRRVTLWNEDSEEYLLEAMYDGDIEIIEVSDTHRFEITEIENAE